MSILRVLSSVPYSNRPPIHDIIASLHSYFTFNLLLGLAILLSYKQFGGRPIECMTPVGFSSSWTEYTENYCYTANTYYIQINQAEETIVNISDAERKERKISYYQWIPFFLIFQAACFKVPVLIWKYFHAQSGMKVGEILRLATNEANGDPTARTENIKTLCGHLQRVLKFHHRLVRRHIQPYRYFRLLNLKYSTYYVALIYWLCKCLFFLNVIGQLNLINRFVFNAKSSFGFDFWQNMLQWNSTFWKESGVFPRVTWCDFDVREMGQSVNHTVQCVLVLNVLMEKTFVLLWAWYCMLAALTLANISTWCFGLFSDPASEHFIFNHLLMSGESLFEDEAQMPPREMQHCVQRFIKKYLRTDGLFILRLISQHADVVFSTELIYRMWKGHYQIEKQREALRKSEPVWRKHLLALEKMNPITSATAEAGMNPQTVDEHTFPMMGRGSRWGSVTSLDDSVMIKLAYGMVDSLESLHILIVEGRIVKEVKSYLYYFIERIIYTYIYVESLITDCQNTILIELNFEDVQEAFYFSS